MRIKKMSIVNGVAKIAVCFLSILSLTAQEKKLDYKDQSYQLINLEINTPYSEYGVNYFKNGKVVYSAPSKKTIKKSKKTSYIHMYEGVLAKDGKIVNQQKFHMELDSDFHEANFVFTKDGKRVYFTNGDQNKGAGIRGKGHIQLYCADVVRGFLEDITLLSFNETISSTGYPFLTDNDQTLYFSSDRYGGKGGMDLYKVAILGKNSFGKIVPLSGKINTSADEIYPFIDIDNVLYFSSNSKDSKGGLDVYAVSLDIEAEEVFQLPAPVNSAKDDFAFVLSPSNQGFLSSNREGGKGADDIYALKVGSL